jgi:hypothetical protein
LSCVKTEAIGAILFLSICFADHLRLSDGDLNLCSRCALSVAMTRILLSKTAILCRALCRVSFTSAPSEGAGFFFGCAGLALIVARPPVVSIPSVCPVRSVRELVGHR